MVIRGTIRLGDGRVRTETMDIGHYMSQETLDRLKAAYAACECPVGEDEPYPDPVEQVINWSLTHEYMPGHGPIELLDVEELSFPG